MNKFRAEDIAPPCIKMGCFATATKMVVNCKGAKYGARCAKHAEEFVRELEASYMDVPVSDLPHQ